MLLVVTSVTSLGPQGHRQGHRVIAEPSSIPAKPVSSVRSTIVFQGWIQSLGTRGLSGGLGGRVCPPLRSKTASRSVRLFLHGSPAGCHVQYVSLCAHRCTHSVIDRLKLNSTTRTRPDPHGPNGVSPQKKSVRVRSGPCSGI